MGKNNQITLSKSFYLILLISFNIIFCNYVFAQNNNFLPIDYTDTGFHIYKLDIDYIPIDTILPEPLILYLEGGTGADTLRNSEKTSIKTNQIDPFLGELMLINPDTIYRLNYFDCHKEYKYLPIYLCKYHNVKDLYYFKGDNTTIDTSILCLQNLINLEIDAFQEYKKLTVFPFFISKLPNLTYLRLYGNKLRFKKKDIVVLNNIRYLSLYSYSNKRKLKFSKHLFNMPNIEMLHINGLKLNLPNLKNYKRLKNLIFECKNLDKVNKIISDCDSIQYLLISDINSKEISEKALSYFLNMKQLKSLELRFETPVKYDIDKIRALIEMYKKQHIEIKFRLIGNPELKGKDYLLE